jgi:hypothetical protein
MKMFVLAVLALVAVQQASAAECYTCGNVALKIETENETMGEIFETALTNDSFNDFISTLILCPAPEKTTCIDGTYCGLYHKMIKMNSDYLTATYQVDLMGCLNDIIAEEDIGLPESLENSWDESWSDDRKCEEMMDAVCDDMDFEYDYDYEDYDFDLGITLEGTCKFDCRDWEEEEFEPKISTFKITFTFDDALDAVGARAKRAEGDEVDLSTLDVATYENSMDTLVGDVEGFQFSRLISVIENAEGGYEAQFDLYFSDSVVPEVAEINTLMTTFASDNGANAEFTVAFVPSADTAGAADLKSGLVGLALCLFAALF